MSTQKSIYHLPLHGCDRVTRLLLHRDCDRDRHAVKKAIEN